MRLDYIFFLSSRSLVRRKLRSVLTIGGMAVGIALIIFLLSLGFGLQRLIKNQITNVEALTVLDVSKGESTLLELNEKTIDKFQKLESVQEVSPSISISGQVAKGDSVTDVAIYGIIPQFISMEGVKINYGKEFSTPEAKEIVITITALNLIGIGSPQETIGSDLNLKVMVPTKSGDTGEEELVSKEIQVKIAGIISDDQELGIVYAPLKFLEDLGFPTQYTEAKVKVGKKQLEEFSLARVKVKDQAKLGEVRKQIQDMGYQVDSIADTVGQIDKIFLVFEIVMGIFGAIAMFVAAMGALNTLTVSLLERTREIGVMKALGSVGADIYRLFLVESILIGMTGGIVGIIIGYALGEGVNMGINYLAKKAGGEIVDIFYTPWLFAVGVLVICFLVSVITGFYPARRAARINPLDALRYE